MNRQDDPTGDYNFPSRKLEENPKYRQLLRGLPFLPVTLESKMQHMSFSALPPHG